MKDSTIIKTGVTGSVIAAICCFTPILVVLLGTVGLLGLARVDRLCAGASARPVPGADRLWTLAAAAGGRLLRHRYRDQQGSDLTWPTATASAEAGTAPMTSL